MKARIKEIVIRIAGEQFWLKVRRLRILTNDLVQLVSNYHSDCLMFLKHSMVFSQTTYKKSEARIILHYHSIEKGFLHDQFRFRFGKEKIEDLVTLLKLPIVEKHAGDSQIAAGYLAICKYYEKHVEANVSVSDFLKREDYERFKKLLIMNREIVHAQRLEEFFSRSEHAFRDFAKSRASVRNFSGEEIPLAKIHKVIELANTAPSVCNRQPNQVYYIEQKTRIDRILAIQQGLRGYSDEIHQMLVLVTDRNFFYSVGERNQMYIDGGLYLMNLLYSLHYYRIGACPAHWCFNREHDVKIAAELSLHESQKVICLIPIGVPKSHFQTTLSLRRSVGEVLKVVDA